MSLKELRSRSSNLKSLQEKAAKIGQKNSYEDPDADTYWKLTIGKDGNAKAEIRFLPAPQGEDDDFVQLNSHFFKNPTTQKWYIDNSLTTLGQNDPVSDYYIGLSKDERQTVPFLKTRREYISNILVINDPANPAANGKVFRFKYGAAILDMIKGALVPEDEDEVARNPFDAFEGMNFKIKYRTEKGFGKYDKSTWGDESPLADNDAEIEDIWSKAYPLAKLIAPEKFKTREALEKKFATVMGWDSYPTGTSKPKKAAPPARKSDDTDDEKAEDSPPWDGDDSDDEDNASTLARLRKLAAADD
jgi:hypothetical protein